MTDDHSVHEGHRRRMKQRFQEEGLDSFADHQILEMLLFFTVPRRDTNQTAHLLLAAFGSLAGVLEAEAHDLAKVDGVGESTALLLTLLPHLTRRYLQDRWGERPILDSTTRAGNYVVDLLSGRTYEVFYVICLDSQCGVINAVLLFQGTINQAPVYPRMVVETALRHKAHSVILAHNHPGGSANPSNQDVEVTKNLRRALNGVQIEVHDHVISAGMCFFSFAEKGIL